MAKKENKVVNASIISKTYSYHKLNHKGERAVQLEFTLTQNDLSQLVPFKECLIEALAEVETDIINLKSKK